MAKPRIGIQLYTVRDQLDKDWVGTLRKLREMGYEYVELAGLGPHSPADLRKILDDAGLAAPCNHCTIDRLEDGINGAIDEAKALGAEYIVCPWLPDDRRVDESAWKGCAESLNKAGQMCIESGLTLAYHNHSFEFVRFGDRFALDLLYEETDPTCLQAELDTYWVRHGGEDPLAYMAKLKGRCPILHLKDMADDDKQSFAAVGTGILDFPAILAAAEPTGVVWALVEQDICPGDPLESVKVSLENLKAMGYA